jgi:DNA-binding transcriptional MerR regulator
VSRRRSDQVVPRGRRESVELVKISDLAQRSGVPSPTIKHYMREGLLPAPHQRTSRNMAYYDARLADRIRVIKALQTDRFLPLRLIGDVLQPPPSAELRTDLDDVQRRQLGMLAPAIQAGANQARRQRGDAGGRRDRDDVLGSMQISADDLALLERVGLIGRGPFGGEELELLSVIDDTRRKGLGDLFPMEILEPYADAIRELVRFELDLFRRRVLAGARLPAAMTLDDVAREATALGERLVVAMRQRLVLEELTR